MKIYIEYIFIVNFLLDYMILYGTKRILKINRKNRYLFLGSLIGSLTTFLVYIKLNNFNLFIIKILLSFLIIIVGLGIKDLKNKFLYFYLLSVIIGGVIYLFDLNKNNKCYFLLLVILSVIVIYIVIKEFINYREKIVNKYLVKIYYKNNCYEVVGFIDTGNNLTSPYKKEPVILVNLKINTNKLIYIPYKALNTTGVIPCIKPDKVIINNLEFKSCLVGLAKDKLEINGMECILPNKFKERLC